MNKEQVAFSGLPDTATVLFAFQKEMSTQRTDSEVKVMRQASGIAHICRGNLFLLVDSLHLRERG